MDPRIQAIIALAVLIAVALVIAVIGVIIHRRYTRADDTLPTAFTLDDLRRLHRNGQLSDAEFARAKAVLIAQATGTEPPEDMKTPPAHEQTDASAADNPPSASENTDDNHDADTSDGDNHADDGADNDRNTPPSDTP